VLQALKVLVGDPLDGAVLGLAAGRDDLHENDGIVDRGSLGIEAGLRPSVIFGLDLSGLLVMLGRPGVVTEPIAGLAATVRIIADSMASSRSGRTT
jgi:hypothetical protein